MNKFLVSTALLFVLAGSATMGCSSDDSGDDDTSSSSSSGGASSGGGSSSGGSSSSSGSSGTISSSSSSGSSGTAALNNCTTFEDHSNGTDDVKIQWINPIGDNRCAKIKVGTKVIWEGNMVDHPLAPQGGDSGTPIVLTATNVNAEFVFRNAGDFGYVCTKHGNMQGVIQVVP